MTTKRPHELRPVPQVIHKTFKVAAVSANTNEFGLRQMILIASDGECWKVHANYLNVKGKGELVEVAVVGGEPGWASLSYEIPSRISPDAPQNVIDEVWRPG